MVRAAVGGLLGSRVREVRGEGLLIGIDCDGGETAGELVLELLHRRVIVSHSLNANRVVRLTPPAILEQAHVDWLVEALTAAAATLGRARESSGGGS
jgi:putrescine aminotransferase